MKKAVSTKRATITKRKLLLRAVKMFLAEHGDEMKFHCYVFKPTSDKKSAFVAIVRPI